jgi:amino acid transporter
MRNRAFAAVTAVVSALFFVAAPAFADQEFAVFNPPIDWRLVIVFTAVGLFVFGLALRGVRRRR